MLNIRQDVYAKIKSQQKFLLSLGMQQAFHVLQMPIEELAIWVNEQIEQNPLLEWDEQSRKKDPDYRADGFSHKRDLPNREARNTLSLYEHLMLQARQVFSETNELEIAKQIIGNLNRKGFHEISFEANEAGLNSILAKIQEFDPPGIAAANERESLLIQLRHKEKQNSLAYKIVENHFDDLIYQRISTISKKLCLSEQSVAQIIREEISPLDPFPGYRFQVSLEPALVPDIFVFYEDEKWKIEINDRLLPTYRLTPHYPNFLQKENRQFLRSNIVSAKWITRSIQRRGQTLTQITEFLLRAQSSFFLEEKGSIQPLNMKEAAEALGLHESTIARAVNQKYLSCPMGIFPLRSFFSQALNKQGKGISCDTAKKTLRKLIDAENKEKPLSDRQLLQSMLSLGIPCARRTITKYRKVMHIPTQRLRKIR